MNENDLFLIVWTSIIAVVFGWRFFLRAKNLPKYRISEKIYEDETIFYPEKLELFSYVRFPEKRFYKKSDTVSFSTLELAEQFLAKKAKQDQDRKAKVGTRIIHNFDPWLYEANKKFQATEKPTRPPKEP